MQIFPKPLVIYYEQHQHPLMNIVISRMKGDLQQILEQNGYSLVYFPEIWERGNPENPAVTGNFRYFKPEYHVPDFSHPEHTRRKMAAPYYLQVLYRGLSELLGRNDYPRAGFIIINEKGRSRTAEFYHIASEAKEQADPKEYLAEEILNYFNSLLSQRKAGERGIVAKEFLKQSVDFKLYSLSEFDASITAPDPETLFEAENKKAKLEVDAELQRRLEGMDNAVAIDLLIRIMEHVSQESPHLAMELEELLKIQLRKSGERLSRMQLLVTHGGYDYRIILPDYDLEIEMPQLPKALFLFFIRHPKGIQLTDLPDYSEELLSIYSRIANLTATKTIADNISRLTDLSDNSVHVNFARIKKAFLLKLTEKVAANYYITGKRGRAKRIHLPQQLLEVDPLLQNI